MKYFVYTNSNDKYCILKSAFAIIIEMFMPLNNHCNNRIWHWLRNHGYFRIYSTSDSGSTPCLSNAR